MTQARKISAVLKSTLFGGRLWHVSIWLLSVVVVFGLVLGQTVELSSPDGGHSEQSVEASTLIPASETTGFSCHPATACAPFILPADSGVKALSLAVIGLGSQLERSQILFGGPTVDLPPPRRQL